MKVALINEYYRSGSTGKLVNELCVGLNRNFVKTKIFYAVGEYKDEFCEPISNRYDQKIHAILSRLTGLQGYFSYFTTLNFIKRLDLYNPDIIHLHNLHGNYINLKLLLSYAANKNKAVVITLHDCWFYTGKCTHYVPAQCKKWKQECGDCPLLHIDNVNPTFFFDTTRKCLNDKREWFGKIQKLGVIGVSEWVTKEVEQSLFKDIAEIVTINNWVDSKIFYPRVTDLRSKLCLNDKKIILLVTSNICKKKGYDELIYLSKTLPSEYQIIVIGKNIDNLYLTDNIIHIERTDNQDKLAEFYSIADVCVNTTKYETFGMVTIEAMACGTPVIVYNNTASQYLVPEGFGVVVDENNGFDEIKQAIYKLSKQKKNAFSIISSKTIEKYNIQNAILAHQKLYEKLKE